MRLKRPATARVGVVTRKGTTNSLEIKLPEVFDGFRDRRGSRRESAKMSQQCIGLDQGRHDTATCRQIPHPRDT